MPRRFVLLILLALGNLSVFAVAEAASSVERSAAVPERPGTVIAVLNTGVSTTLADWSSRGPWVDVTAPGCSPLPMVLGTYAWACGTSFAEPVAAGVAGLARAVDPDASAATIAGRLPALLASAHAPDGTIRINGRPVPGATLRATATGFTRDRDLGERVRWFRCAADSSPHTCAAVSTGPAYRVRAADTGWTLVARVVTEPFGGLWLASSPRLPVT